MSEVTRKNLLTIVVTAILISFVAFVMAEQERFNLTGWFSVFSKGDQLFDIVSPINIALIAFVLISMGIVMALNIYLIKHRNK
jgi:hypothetical protein